MKYLINYNTGAIQHTDKLELGDMVSLISSGAVQSIVDIANKKALMANGSNIGWANIEEFGNFSQEELNKLK